MKSKTDYIKDKLAKGFTQEEALKEWGKYVEIQSIKEQKEKALRDKKIVRKNEKD